MSLLGHIAAILVFSRFGLNSVGRSLMQVPVMADGLPIQMYFVYIAPPVMMVVTMLYAAKKCCVRACHPGGDFEDVSQTSKTAEMLEVLSNRR
ncbi:hypothetical protein O9929_12205 [Vibrio lentus]|nr:hypothetical protein [Vibrio lentus]